MEYLHKEISIPRIFLKLNRIQKKAAPASWSSGNAFVSGAEGLRFKSRAGSVANGSPPQRYFL